ncbi:hypothetical protein E2562_011347 [Oryza meyeriana var. granulata]|uniref:Uncharacterized protein n=1 Tax=Oryza meyeriana var. granulata TaxID=110450 RepID=A0A6G1BW11_9ORYZ|nr:hypothetical protein E2562_011347 [Oryza meyeriana var. granulata]
MKQRDRRQAIAKLSSGARDLLLFMSAKKAKAMLAVVVAVVAKCRELWEGLLTAGSGCAVAHSAADDGYYFGRSHEFSCSATPVFSPAAKGGGRRRGRRRCLPPCVGGKQAREMLLETMTMSPSPWPVAGGRECSSPPERSPQCWREQEIDGLAEDFINRFYEQLRLQVAEERRLGCRASPSTSP